MKGQSLDRLNINISIARELIIFILRLALEFSYRIGIIIGISIKTELIYTLEIAIRIAYSQIRTGHPSVIIISQGRIVASTLA